jgi:tellurite resistance protein TerC
LIFGYFQLPLALQHRVLFWGILGAIVMRGVMITLGAALLVSFQWMSYAFGALLIFTAAKILVVRHDNLEPNKNPLVRMARRVFPVTADFEGKRFFSKVNGKTAITPLFLALLVVESSDLLFAIDSIPAIFAITTDPFLVFTSNIFAILGLRSLYFALAGLLDRFRYLKMSLVFLLVFVGVKMLLTHHYPIGVPVSLAMILGILSLGVIASLLAGHRDTAALVSPIVDELEDLSRLTVRQAKRLAVLVVGGGLLLAGAAMLVLPGPGLLVIFAALTVLGTHFVWARRLLRRARRETRMMMAKGQRLIQKRNK